MTGVWCGDQVAALAAFITCQSAWFETRLLHYTANFLQMHSLEWEAADNEVLKVKMKQGEEREIS